MIFAYKGKGIFLPEIYFGKDTLKKGVKTSI